MARVLIVGDEKRAALLGAALLERGCSVRVAVASAEALEALGSTGLEGWIGSADRLASLRGALERVTVACWLFGSAGGDAARVAELHGSRLASFVRQLVDSSARGLAYEAAGSAPAEVLAGGMRTAIEACAAFSLPLASITADPTDERAWLADACEAIAGLLSGRAATRTEGSAARR